MTNCEGVYKLATEETLIPYENVAIKLNQYYKAIKNEWVGKAEELQIELRQIVDPNDHKMKENQDVCLYFSLLEFRHQLMLEYKFPKVKNDLVEKKAKDVDKQYKDILMNHFELTSLLEYYYNFFTGMFHFKQGELIDALSFYRFAEKYLDEIEGDDIDIEKAEFYFKLSEVFYHMKQTYFSMNYAQRAYRIFSKCDKTEDGKPTYVERKIQCQFVISGNWLDNHRSKEALEYAQRALEDAKDLDGTEKNADHLRRKALFNLGLCYNQMEELDVATQYFLESLEIPDANEAYIARALFLISFISGKKGDISGAETYYNKSKQIADQHGIVLIKEKLKIVEGLFLKSDYSVITEAFEFFDKHKHYPDMEEYGIEVAELLTKKGEFDGANEFYRWSIKGRKNIKRGEMQYEN